MFIFTKNDKFFVYIDIPVPIQTYVRKQIINDLYKIIKHYWFIREDFLDLAHIPYKLRKEYVRQDFDHIYFTFARNPYQKFISTFLNTVHSDEMTAKEFILNKLANERFEDYHHSMIHFYPQYKFIVDEYDEIDPTIKIYKFEEYKNEFIKFTDRLELKNHKLSDYFDNETLAIFNNIYKKDFQVFDYPMIDNISNEVILPEYTVIEPVKSLNNSITIKST